MEDFKNEVNSGLDQIDAIYSKLKSKAAAATMESDEYPLQEEFKREESKFISKSVHDQLEKAFFIQRDQVSRVFIGQEFYWTNQKSKIDNDHSSVEKEISLKVQGLEVEIGRLLNL